MEAHRRLRSRQLRRQNLPATRTRRSQGRDQIDVGGHGPAAGRGRLGDDIGVAAALLPRQPVAARDGSRRDGPRQEGVRRGDRAWRGLRLRHAGAALRPRLSAREFHLAADQPARRRIWRHARQPPALSAGDLRGDARGVAGTQADVGAHLRHRLGRGRHHRRRCGDDRARLRRGRRRPHRRLDRADRARRAAGLRPHVPDAVLRAGSQRGPGRDHVRRQHHDSRSGQHHSRRRPRRPGGAGPAAPRGPVVHDAGGGLVRHIRYRLPAAISARQGADFPQQPSRPPGPRGPQNQG